MVPAASVGAVVDGLAADVRGHGNHLMFGSVDDWLFRDVAGIAPSAPGFKRTLIEPHPGPLTAAHAEHESPYGEIVSDWASHEGRFTLGVAVPVNTTATVRVPVPEGGDARVVGDARGVRAQGVSNGYAQFAVGSGRYRFVAPARSPAVGAGSRSGCEPEGISIASSSTKRAPGPLPSSWRSSPPMRRASSRPMARPRPNPPSPDGVLPRSKRSKIRSRSIGATPGPSSATSTVALVPW